MDKRSVVFWLPLAMLAMVAAWPRAVAQVTTDTIWSLESPAISPRVEITPLFDSQTVEDVLGGQKLWISPRIDEKHRSKPLLWTRSGGASARESAAEQKPIATKAAARNTRDHKSSPGAPPRAARPTVIAFPSAPAGRSPASANRPAVATAPRRVARREPHDPEPAPQAPLPPKTSVAGSPPRRKAPRPAKVAAANKTAADKPAKKGAPALKPLSRRQRRLRTQIRRTLRHFYERPLAADRRSPWEVMHAVLAFEVHSRILESKGTNLPITAVGWLCYNRPCRNRTLLHVNDEGELRVKVGPGLQGHEGQLLAMLAQARVQRDYPIKVEGRDFTVADLIEQEKSTCYARTELTFKLIGLMHYLDSDATWVNDQGDVWDFRRLVKEELRQPIRGAACGGTHRLAGLSLAVKHRQRAQQPIDGEYAQAKRFVANYQRYAYRLQNSDGSFSTEWFRGPGDEEDINRRLKTTGHILEWLLYTSTPQQLSYSRLTRATHYLTTLMYSNRFQEWEAGPLGHALHSLILYDRLVFAKYDKQQERSAKRSSLPWR